MSDVRLEFGTDNFVVLDRATFDRMLEALRFTARAEDPLDRVRASERAALLLIDLESAARLNVRGADICQPGVPDLAKPESTPTGDPVAALPCGRAVLRPTDDIRFGSGFPESVPPIVLHPAARTCDIASVDGDFVADLIHPHIAELTTILGHLRDAIEPRSRSAIPGATDTGVTR